MIDQSISAAADVHQQKEAARARTEAPPPPGATAFFRAPRRRKASQRFGGRVSSRRRRRGQAGEAGNRSEGKVSGGEWGPRASKHLSKVLTSSQMTGTGSVCPLRLPFPQWGPSLMSPHRQVRWTDGRQKGFCGDRQVPRLETHPRILVFASLSLRPLTNGQNPQGRHGVCGGNRSSQSLLPSSRDTGEIALCRSRRSLQSVGSAANNSTRRTPISLPN